MTHGRARDRREDDALRNLDDRIEALIAAPAGCAFLLTVEDAGLTPEVAARPEVAVHAAAIAQSEINPWMPDHQQQVRRALGHGPRLRGLAAAILARAEAAAWFAPVARAAQEWIPSGGPGAPAPDPARLVVPSGPPTRWERYAQKPAGGFYTSTAFGGTSSALAGLDHCAGDYNLRPPLARYRLEAAAGAQVYEIGGPADWHRLCVRYPAVSEEDGRLVPDWAAVARDWDAVHLTLGGLLTAEQVRTEGAAGWTEHGFWDAEQTVWLRWCFARVVRLPDLPDFPDPPVLLRRPMALFPLLDEPGEGNEPRSTHS